MKPTRSEFIHDITKQLNLEMESSEDSWIRCLTKIEDAINAEMWAAKNRRGDQRMEEFEKNLKVGPLLRVGQTDSRMP